MVPGPDALYATFTLRSTENLSGWRSRNQRCEPAQVLSDGGQNKLIPGAWWTTQSKSAELQDALQVRKPHLDLLALTSRYLEALGASERPGNVPGVLMEVARDLARWFFWTALRFKRAYIAVELARSWSSPCRPQAWRMERDASTSTMTPNFTSIE